MNVHSADKNIHRCLYRSSLVIPRAELAQIVPQTVKAIVKIPWPCLNCTHQQYIRCKYRRCQVKRAINVLLAACNTVFNHVQSFYRGISSSRTIAYSLRGWKFKLARRVLQSSRLFHHSKVHPVQNHDHLA